MHARALLVLTAMFLLPACAGRLESTVRKKASSDFQCAADQVQVESQTYSGLSGTYVARGCDQESEYASRCGLIGICSASQPGQAPPAYASNGSGGGGSSAPPPSDSDPAAGGSDPGSSAPPEPAAPTSVSFTLRNSCGQNVKIFFGDKPKFGSGTYSSMSSNSSTSKSMAPGDMIWIVDDSQNGISSATIGNNTKNVEITGDCTSISAR